MLKRGIGAQKGRHHRKAAVTVRTVLIYAGVIFFSAAAAYGIVTFLVNLFAQYHTSEAGWCT